MPSFVNIGAYVDEGTMVDTWATVGSCAQIGKHVHLSGGVGIGGVLEPLQANPTIIEDNCFIGARSEVAEGVIVREGAVLAWASFSASRPRSSTAPPARSRSAKCRPTPWSCPAPPGQAAARRQRRPQPLLRRDRQARRRADALEDQRQRTAAGLSYHSRRQSRRATSALQAKAVRFPLLPRHGSRQ